MPLQLRQAIKPHEGLLGMWHITESEEFFRHHLSLSAAEQAQLQPLKGRRRIEWLAVRYLVHVLSERKVRGSILKDSYGKPQLEGSKWHISISHSRDRAAVIASPHIVGVDIQVVVPHIARIAHKFMRSEERAALDPHHLIPHMHVYWGAKECLYKAWGRRQLDWCTHMRIAPFPFLPEGGHSLGYIEKEDQSLAFDLYYRLIDGFVLTWVVQVIHPSDS